MREHSLDKIHLMAVTKVKHFKLQETIIPRTTKVIKGLTAAAVKTYCGLSRPSTHCQQASFHNVHLEVPFHLIWIENVLNFYKTFNFSTPNLDYDTVEPIMFKLRLVKPHNKRFCWI